MSNNLLTATVISRKRLKRKLSQNTKFSIAIKSLFKRHDYAIEAGKIFTKLNKTKFGK